MAEFRCESIEKYGDCAVDREQWRGEERPIQCSFCCYYKPIMTNAEKIRAMTDEELAEWMSANATNYSCYKFSGMGVIEKYGDNGLIAKSWLDWLKEEYKP